MSADKQKRKWRAYDLLRGINNGFYRPPNLSASRRTFWSTRNPTIKYIVERGFATIVRRRHRGFQRANSTELDTGVEWQKGKEFP